MSMLLSFLLQGAPVAQKTAHEAGNSGGGSDLNQYTWIIICALAGVVVTMGTFGGKLIMRLYSDLKKCQEERSKFVEEQLSLLHTLKEELRKPKP